MMRASHSNNLHEKSGLTEWIFSFCERNSSALLLSTMMLFAILMSVFIYSGQSLRLDEAQSLWQTSRSPLKILNIVAQDVHVPLYHLMLHYWQVFFGNGVQAGRFFSLIFFLLSIPAIYKLGKLVYSKAHGLFAALLLTISPFMNWYGNEIRMYSLFTFMVILHQYFFIRLFKFKGERASSYWFFYALVSLTGIYVHYFFFLSFISQIVFYFFHRDLFKRDDLKKFLKLAGAVIVVFAPWVIYVLSLGTANNSSPRLVSPSTIDIFNTISQFLFGFQSEQVNTILVSLWPILVLLLFLSLRKNARISNEVLYLVLSFILPLTIAFFVSITFRPVYLSRYLILSVPPFYLLIVGFIMGQQRNNKKYLTQILLFFMLVSFGLQSFSTLTPVKENYREASDFLTANASVSDIIVVSAPFTVYPIDYYYAGPSEVTTLPLWNRLAYGPIPTFDASTLPSEVADISRDHTNVWLLLSYDQGYEDQLRMYFDTHYQRILTKNFSPKLNLYEYKVKY